MAGRKKTRIPREVYERELPRPEPSGYFRPDRRLQTYVPDHAATLPPR